MSAMPQHGPSQAWQAGHSAGSDDCSSRLDYDYAAKSGDAFVLHRGAPATTPNPFPAHTIDHDDWASGYQHGWHETQDLA